MARHDLTQRRREPLKPFNTVERQTRLQQVRIALRGAEVVIQNPFLQRCQRINILHIGRAARHRGDDALDTGLIQLHQRQHVRSDVRAIGRNQIVRHGDLAATAHRRRQRGQGRLAEQHTHVGAQIDLTHALDQRHRQ
ncbi:hypothetical protein D3C72_258010 [compost metagenome]